MDNRPRQDEPRVTVKEFEDPQNPGNGVELFGVLSRPRGWTLSFYSTGKDGRRHRSNSLRVLVDNGRAIGDKPGMRYARLIDEAALFKENACQTDSDEFIARRQVREYRDIERQARSGPEVKPSPLGKGMTAEERAAKKNRHENNLAARRSADQELRQKMRGK
jgi:hypothetical protein